MLGALAAEVAALEGVLSGLSEAEAGLATRCAPWDVAALAAHTVGAVVRVEGMLVTEAPEGALVSAAGYYSPDARFSVEVNRERVDSAVEAAARRADAGEPGRVLRERWAVLEPVLRGASAGRTVVTRHGDPMLLSEFLVTRVVEVVVHGLDLADALGREPWTTGRGLDVVRGLLFGSADAEALEGVFPGALSERGAGLAAVRAVTGRAGSGGGRVALEEAGVRFLALG
ncbi:mycothiol maleylpyruvate isomerase [Glycomyces fuscus]|nr:mycothiol maleylpyruvate isomerase [Glycomyces fuscus]